MVFQLPLGDQTVVVGIHQAVVLIDILSPLKE